MDSSLLAQNKKLKKTAKGKSIEGSQVANGHAEKSSVVRR
jgi:hypothetical protein